MGIDLGDARIGLAVSDSDGLVASPYEVLVRTRDAEGDRRRLAELVSEAEAEVVVVGVPYSLDGSVGRAARRALAEIDGLRRGLSVPVETYDERLSTVTAQRSIREMNLNPVRRRAVVDKIAAAIILQGWLDHRRGTDPGGPTPTPHADEDDT